MKRIQKIAIVAGLIVLVGVVLALKQTERQRAVLASAPKTNANLVPKAAPPRPKFVEVGSDKCQPCKMMTPILDELRREYPDAMQVEFIDIFKGDPAKEIPYGVKTIPSQIFLDPAGKELFRHEGFFPKADILAKWKTLGYDLPRKPARQ